MKMAEGQGSSSELQEGRTEEGQRRESKNGQPEGTYSVFHPDMSISISPE
jgi:hypothetical protein